MGSSRYEYWSGLLCAPLKSGYPGQSGLPRWLSGKESTCQCRRCEFNPGGLERSPGEGNGSPFQYPYLGNPMDRGAWWATVHGVLKVRLDLVTTTTTQIPRRAKARSSEIWSNLFIQGSSEKVGGKTLIILFWLYPLYSSLLRGSNWDLFDLRRQVLESLGVSSFFFLFLSFLDTLWCVLQT